MPVPPHAPGTHQSSTFPVSSCWREGANSAGVCLRFAAATLSPSLSFSALRTNEKEVRAERGGEERSGAGIQRRLPPRFSRGSEYLREFSTTLTADKLPSSDLAAPVSKTQQAAGERGARGVGVGGRGGLPHQQQRLSLTQSCFTV